MDEGVDYMSDHILYIRYIAYCTFNFSLLSFMHGHNLLKLFVELFVFVLVFLTRIVLRVFHPHTYLIHYSLTW